MSGFSTTLSDRLSTFTGRFFRPKSPSSFNSPTVVRLQISLEPAASLTDRQERLEWWSQERCRLARILVAGCGGLGSKVVKSLVQMGFGWIDVADPDLVEPSNLHRQEFVLGDVGGPKAHRILDRVRPHATASMQLRGFYLRVEDVLGLPDVPQYSVIICAVDPKSAMVEVARHGLRTGTPVVYCNISRDAELMRIFIQHPGQACFACYDPHALDVLKNERRPCMPSPAADDICHVAVGFAVRAAVGEIMGLPISNSYNCRDLALSGADIKRVIERNPDCTLCAGVASSRRERADSGTRLEVLVGGGEVR